MPPEKHALLSASSASRWLKCTAAPRFEEHLPERTSEYAEEGRLAHAICELKTLKKFTVMTSRTYTTRLNKLKKNPLYSEEMDKTSDLYIEHLIEQAMLYDSTPTVVAEVQVDFGEYVPEGFGTCDNVMIGGDTLSITDYKHGKGVPVSAVGNPQMRLYALGALKRYAPVFGDAIKKVRMSIDQPRLDSYTTNTITVEELMAWGENIKPIAQKAFSGLGEFVPGDHCRFCRGKAQCRARANTNTALEDFKDCVPAASVPPDAKTSFQCIRKAGEGHTSPAFLLFIHELLHSLQVFIVGVLYGHKINIMLLQFIEQCLQPPPPACRCFQLHGGCYLLCVNAVQKIQPEGRGRRERTFTCLDRLPVDFASSLLCL